jgi:hypothetical protein
MNPSSYETLIGVVRQKCGSPPIAALSDGLVERLLRGRIDFLITELNLSKNLWVSAQKILQFNPGDDIITVTGDATEFGKPYTVETMDSADPNHQARQISIVDMAVLTQTYRGGDAVPFGEKHSAEAIAFFVEGAEWKARLGPKTSQFAEYRCLYEPPVAQPSTLEARAFPFQQFEDYLTWCGAEVALPYAKKWFKKTDDLETYDDLLGTSTKMVEQGALQFSRWKRTNRNGNNFKARMWAQNRRFRRR